MCVIRGAFRRLLLMWQCLSTSVTGLSACVFQQPLFDDEGPLAGITQ